MRHLTQLSESLAARTRGARGDKAPMWALWVVDLPLTAYKGATGGTAPSCTIFGTLGFSELLG